MTFGHGSWDTFGASTVGGNQVFHGWIGDAWDNFKDKASNVYDSYRPDEKVSEVVLENPTCAANKRQLTIRVYRNNLTSNKAGKDFAEDELYQKAWMREWIEPTEATQALDDAGNPMTDADGLAIMEGGTEGSWKTLSRSDSKSLKEIEASAHSELHPELVEWATTNGWETGGCTDENATNYSEDASCDDGSCECSEGYEMDDDGICAEIVEEEETNGSSTITTQSGSTTTVAAGETSKMPLIIGLGVLGVVAFTMMGKKEE